jgi:hypothetical protein
MLLGRPLRRWFCASLVFALLFMQLVTAAHACPLLAAAEQPAQAMPCGDMAADAPQQMPSSGLCIKHCQPDAQGADFTHAPVLSAPAVVSMLPLVVANEASADAPQRRGAQALPHATRPPPLSILNCCRRN